jgi:hypothetical protein
VRQGLFRAKAQERLSSPEQLDQLMRVTSPRSWLVLLGLAAIIIAALIWAFVGQVPRTVSGQAILMQPGGLTNVVAQAPGVVAELTVQPGDRVEEGQIIAHLHPLATFTTTGAPVATPVGDLSINVLSPIGGEVVEMLSSPGDVLNIGDAVVSLEGLDDVTVGYVYVTDAEGKQIEPGMEVQLSPVTVDESQYGYLIGTVQSVSEYPVTLRGLVNLLQNERLAEQFLDEGPVLQVVVTLTADPSTASGYAWSSPDGPPFQLSHGTLASGSIVIDEQRPMQFVLPQLPNLVRTGVE